MGVELWQSAVASPGWLDRLKLFATRGPQNLGDLKNNFWSDLGVFQQDSDGFRAVMFLFFCFLFVGREKTM